MIIGIDTGGTFTDVVLFTGRAMFTFKLPSTPGDFSQAVLEGAARVRVLGGVEEAFELVHSTTVATNALLEQKGAKTALITTRGFRDVLEIGRQARPDLYNLNVVKPEPLIPRSLRLEAHERISAEGKVLVELDVPQLEALLDRLKARGVESLAVCLLFSFLRPTHERKIRTLARKRGLTVSLSSEILPEFREYERTATTVANAFVSPVMKTYLRRLEREAKKQGARHVRIMQQNGGCMTTKAAGEQAVHTLLSGPAAGVIGALHIARTAFKCQDVKLITFDMGGTSTDVSLIDGGYAISKERQISGLPIAVPMMDIHTVGAGGGSIAYSDYGGGLHVGPESAGADPGPACYGKGHQPTVTDAHLVLGHLQPDHFLDGRFPLESVRSEQALDPLAKALGLSRAKTAAGIIRIVNANMEKAIRVISVERGYDPRDFTLVSFGGAGGLHACAIAESLNIRNVLIPVNAGVISALGSVCADVVKESAQTVMCPLNAEASYLVPATRMLEGLRKNMGIDGHPSVVGELLLDLRYAGQSFELTVPYREGCVAGDFHALHRKRYGHAQEDAAIEVVNVRARMTAPTKKPALVRLSKSRRPVDQARMKDGALPVYDRRLLCPGHKLAGPLIVVEDYSTTLIPASWIATVDAWGNMLCEKPV
ncbi:MAG: N-methylhydantoinase A [Kiritimatiellia bacterium]|jgi:N-methylhydantoinase A